MSRPCLCSQNLCLMMLGGTPDKHRYLMTVKRAPGCRAVFPSDVRLTKAIRTVFARKEFLLSFDKDRVVLTITVRKAFSISEREKIVAVVDSVTKTEEIPLGPYS